jgi:hypothetical protein
MSCLCPVCDDGGKDRRKEEGTGQSMCWSMVQRKVVAVAQPAQAADCGRVEGGAVARVHARQDEDWNTRAPTLACTRMRQQETGKQRVLGVG